MYINHINFIIKVHIILVFKPHLFLNIRMAALGWNNTRISQERGGVRKVWEGARMALDIY